MQKIDWSKKKELKGISFNEEDFKETIDGGQSFSWYADGECAYIGIFARNIARLSLENNKLFYQEPNNYKNNELEQNLLKFLDAQSDYNNIRQKLYALNDSTLKLQLDKRPSIRILKQPINECIMGFICSSSKRIVQIKQCVALLRQKFGVELIEGFYSLDDFEKIANASLEDLLECKLGFRAKYLKNTAMKIVADGFDTQELLRMDYKDAKDYLCSLSGIGEKVADCILLFSANKTNAFPVDTWIIKSMKNLYNIEKANDIRAYAKANFGEYAGYAQQVLFANEGL